MRKTLSGDGEKYDRQKGKRGDEGSKNAYSPNRETK
jgi:hypothetical protein